MLDYMPHPSELRVQDAELCLHIPQSISRPALMERGLTLRKIWFGHILVMYYHKKFQNEATVTYFLIETHFLSEMHLLIKFDDLRSYSVHDMIWKPVEYV